MANNRMYLKCVCGKEQLMAKLWGDKAQVWGQPQSLQKFLDEHFFCGGNGTGFSIDYEIPPQDPTPSPS